MAKEENTDTTEMLFDDNTIDLYEDGGEGDPEDDELFIDEDDPFEDDEDEEGLDLDEDEEEEDEDDDDEDEDFIPF